MRDLQDFVIKVMRFNLENELSPGQLLHTIRVILSTIMVCI